MPEKILNIWWKRVGITVLVIHLVSYFIVMGIVSGFATYLSFEQYNYPDQTIVDLFVKQYAPTLTQTCLVFFTFFGARSVAKNVESDATKNGITVGVLVAIVYIIFNTGIPVNANLIVSIALMAVLSWLGAVSAGKKPTS